MLTFKIYTESNVFTYSAKSIQGAVVLYKENHRIENIVCIYCLEEQIIITNGIDVTNVDMQYFLQ